MIELTTQDRERIEQEANNYVKLMNWGYHKEAKDDFRKGAEYATKYEREECNKIIERATADQTDTIVILDQKVKQLEAERTEVIRRIKSILKASTVHDKISILEELEQLLNSLKK